MNLSSITTISPDAIIRKSIIILKRLSILGLKKIKTGLLLGFLIHKTSLKGYLITKLNLFCEKCPLAATPNQDPIYICSI